MSRAIAWATVVVALAATAAPASASLVRIGSGGWSWFGDPRAVASGNNVFLGWITPGGDVEVGRVNLRTGSRAQARLHRLPPDDHSNPSLTVLPDGRVAAFYTPHGKTAANPRMWFRVGRHPGGVNSWGPERTVPVNSRGPFGYTYPTPVRVGRYLYLFWRGGSWLPTFTRTQDLRHWAPAQTLLRGQRAHRPYVKYDSYRGGIRFAFTISHPGTTETNVYFAELRDGAIRRADGRRVAARGALPFPYRRADLVYDARKAGRAWVWDIAHDARGNPVVVYATIQNYTKHTYRYARWTGTRWYDRALAVAGPNIDGDPWYSAGVTLDHSDPDVVYMSRQVEGRFELERWETHDGGHTFDTTPVTTASETDNMRPFVPLGTSGDRALLWTAGHYAQFRNFGDLTVMLRAPLPGG